MRRSSTITFTFRITIQQTVCQRFVMRPAGSMHVTKINPYAVMAKWGYPLILQTRSEHTWQADRLGDWYDRIPHMRYLGSQLSFTS